MIRLKKLVKKIQRFLTTVEIYYHHLIKLRSLKKASANQIDYYGMD